MFAYIIIYRDVTEYTYAKPTAKCLTAESNGRSKSYTVYSWGLQ